MQGSIGNTDKYFVEQDKINIRKMREVLTTLPRFSHQYFRSIEGNTSSRTRLGYAYDLRTFFEFLHENNSALKKTAIVDFKLSILDQIKREDIEEYLEHLSLYDKNEKELTNQESGKARKLSALRSFYNFYSSKEMLFFAVLEEYQIDVMNRLTEQLDMEAKIDTNRLVELLYDFYQDFRYSFMYTIFKNHEMELLIRKLPKEAITNHHLIDDRMVKKIVSRINIRENVSVEIVSALFRTIAMTILHIEEIGEEQFDIALKFVIQGIVEQITKEDRQW